MSAIPRYVTTAPEAAARIAGYIFGDGNPDHTDGPLGGAVTFTALDTTSFGVPECQRCAGILSWVLGTDYRIASNGNFICKRDSLYAGLGGHPTTPSIYYRALEPAGSWTPTRVQIEAFLAGVIETEGSASTNPPKVFDEARGGVYDQRIDALVIAMNTQSLGAFRSGAGVKLPLAQMDAFPLPLISDNRYPGDTPADWPDGPPPPPDTTPPPVPTGLASSSGDSSASLTWTVVVADDLAGYRVFRNTVQVYQGTTPALLDTGLTNGVTYSYTVASYDTSNNQSAQSSAVTATPVAPVGPGPDPTPPVAPTNLTGTPSTSSVSLTWTASASPDVVSHIVYRGPIAIGTVDAPITFYSDTGLDSETEYTYRVSAFDSEGLESTSTPFISVTTLATSVGPPPITQVPIQIVSSVGCAENYAVYVADRSGEILLTELPVTGGKWNRIADDISEATIDLDLVNGFSECCRSVQGLARYGYEIVIFRDDVRVWTGPVIDIIIDGENIQIRAKDKMAWLEKRPIWSVLDYPEPGEEVADIFNAVITNAMAPDNVPGLFATATDTGVRAARSYTTNPPQIAFDAVQELARTGVDYTMIGPVMVAGSFVVPASPIAYITDQALAELPSLSLLGSNFTTQWFVTGDPEQNLRGAYGGADALCGLVVSLAQEDDIKDQVSLDQNAKSRWELTSGAFIADITLRLDQTAPLPMELAVPGAVVDLRLTESCYPVTGQYRMKSFSVSFSSSSDGLAEQVEMVVEPIGTELIA